MGKVTVGLLFNLEEVVIIHVSKRDEGGRHSRRLDTLQNDFLLWLKTMDKTLR